MKHLKLYEDWNENDTSLTKGEKLVKSVKSHGLSVGDKVIIPQFNYGNETLTNLKGTIKQIQLSYVNEQPRYHYNIHFDTPIGNDKQVKRNNWMFGPYGEGQLKTIRKI